MQAVNKLLTPLRAIAVTLPYWDSIITLSPYCTSRAVPCSSLVEISVAQRYDRTSPVQAPSD